MKIIIQYDADVSGAPAGFKTAVNEAVDYLDRLISDNIQVTIQFGWGKSGSVDANQPGVAGESEPAVVSVFQPTASNTLFVSNALAGAYAKNGLSGWLTPSVLTADFATTSQFKFLEMGYAQAAALGLLNNPNLGMGPTTGFVAVNSTLNYNFDVHATPTPSSLDVISVLLHEITHALGRAAGFTAGSDTVEMLFDFFRYDSQGHLQTAPGGGFFSLNGHVLTNQFEAANQDPADWVQSVANDSNGFAPFGNAFNYSAVDKLELAALGFQVRDFSNSYLGDAQSEVLIQNGAGAVVVGALSGNKLVFTNIAGLGSEWKFVAASDFLGDGVSDALIENSAGAVVVAEDVGGKATFTTVGALGAEWSFHGGGDFYGDQNNEFLIQNTAGAVVLGHVSGGHAVYQQVAGLGAEWSFRGVGNFLGDGKDGFLIENKLGAIDVGEVGLNNQTTFVQVAGLGSEWSFRENGDFLGDGKDDFLIENKAGAVFVGEVGSNHQTTFTQLTSLGSEWKFVGAGDFLGEGHDQFIIENTAGAVDLADWTGGQIHFTQISALGPEWVFH